MLSRSGKKASISCAAGAVFTMLSSGTMWTDQSFEATIVYLQKTIGKKWLLLVNRFKTCTIYWGKYPRLPFPHHRLDFVSMCWEYHHHLNTPWLNGQCLPGTPPQRSLPLPWEMEQDRCLWWIEDNTQSAAQPWKYVTRHRHFASGPKLFYFFALLQISMLHSRN